MVEDVSSAVYPPTAAASETSTAVNSGILANVLPFKTTTGSSSVQISLKFVAELMPPPVLLGGENLPIPL